MIVETAFILESLVAVIGVYTPGDSIAEEYGDVSWDIWFMLNSPRSMWVAGVNEMVGRA